MGNSGYWKGKGKVKEAVPRDPRRKVRLAPELDEDDVWTHNTILARPLHAFAQKTKVMAAVMPRIWGMQERVKGRDLGNGIVQFLFQNESDIVQVETRGPWNLEDWLVPLRRWEEEEARGPDFFDEIPIWLQLWGIPARYLKPDTIQNIAAACGRVLELDFDVHNSASVEFIRVRVALNINDPIVSDLEVTLPSGEECIIDLRYERLKKFCHYCGMLDHSDLDCVLLKADTKNNRPRSLGLGLHMRAEDPRAAATKSRRPLSNRLAGRLGPQQLVHSPVRQDHSQVASSSWRQQETNLSPFDRLSYPSNVPLGELGPYLPRSSAKRKYKKRFMESEGEAEMLLMSHRSDTEREVPCRSWSGTSREAYAHPERLQRGYSSMNHAGKQPIKDSKLERDTSNRTRSNLSSRADQKGKRKEPVTSYPENELIKPRKKKGKVAIPKPLDQS